MEIQTSPEAPAAVDRQPEVVDFGNIAISFSGGGYRASAYHLGSMDFLHKVGLLERVTMLSTVSGGTITGAKYALSLSDALQKGQKHSFENFYNELRKFFLEERLPDKWLANLRPQGETKPSLIAAAANVYSEGLFDGAQFKRLTAVKSQMHLKEIVFNTTELRTATDFRFRIGDGGYVGNGNLPIPIQLLQEVRIADVVAASSCFPGGFEPIVFPQDFKFQKDWKTVREEVESDLKKNESKIRPETMQGFLKTLKVISEEPLPLIDGGIYDNLGTGALLLANERLKKRFENEKDSTKKEKLREEFEKGKIGTLIISDTDNIGVAAGTDEMQALFQVPKPISSNWLTRLTVKQFANIIRTAFYIFALSTIGFALYALYTFIWGSSITIGILSIWATLVFGVLTFVLYWLTNLIGEIASIPNKELALVEKQSESKSNKSVLNSLREIVLDWSSFLEATRELAIADVLNLLSFRLFSISPLFLAFLKGQRRQSYSLVFEIEDVKQRVINNFIRDTDIALEKRAKGDKKALESSIIPTKEMAELAELATQTPTTLWFDADKTKAQEQLDTVIACGQITMCFNLLEYIEKVEKQPNTTLSPAMQDVRQRVLAAWNQFQQNPKIWVGDNREQALADWEKL